jgi:hypothetical protein
MAAGPKFSLVKLKKFSIYVEEKYVWEYKSIASNGIDAVSV